MLRRGHARELAKNSPPRQAEEPRVIQHNNDLFEPIAERPGPKPVAEHGERDVVGAISEKRFEQGGNARAKTSAAEHNPGGTFSFQGKRHSKPANSHDSQNAAGNINT